LWKYPFDPFDNCKYYSKNERFIRLNPPRWWDDLTAELQVEVVRRLFALELAVAAGACRAVQGAATWAGGGGGWVVAHGGGDGERQNSGIRVQY
jgi:hypothetical protein